MDIFIFIIGLLAFIGFIGYLIYLLIKKQKYKLETSLIGIGISFVLMIVGVSWGVSKDNSKNSQLAAIQTALSETKTTTEQSKTENKNQNSNYEEVKVTKHVDGDTVEITHKDGKTDRIRFIGVNTPESTTQHEQYGQEASDYTKSKLLDKTVYLEKDAGDKDTYGRLLRYVWLEIPKDNSETEIKSKMFNAILTEEGYAEQMTVQPNVKYADNFKKFCAEARTGNKGLWAINPNGTTKGDNITPAPTQSNSSTNGNTNSNTNNNSSNIKTETSSNQSSSSSNSGNTSSTETKQYQEVKVQEVPTVATVYVTPTGKKYHRAGCRTIKGSSKAISKDEAINEGYDACKVCNP